MTGPYSRHTSVLDDERLVQHGVHCPLVTVVVTCFNYADYITDCLRSIAEQDYASFHCVVVDDCSTDQSVDNVRDFLATPAADNRFNLVCHEQNLGQMGAFRTGLAHAKGVFLVFVDADDLLLENFISAHVRAHLDMEPVAFTSSDQYQINEKNELISGHHSDLQAKGAFKLVRSESIHHPFWVWATTSSMMFRRAVLELVMPDDCDHFRICADNYLSHFANLVGGSLLIPEVYGCYRRHGQNRFSSNSLVGGSHPTGNMKNHPRHDIIRQAILRTLVRRHADFCAVLSEGGFGRLLSLAGNYWEVIKIARRYPLFKEDLKFYFLMELLVRSSTNHFKTIICRCRELNKIVRK